MPELGLAKVHIRGAIAGTLERTDFGKNLVLRISARYDIHVARLVDSTHTRAATQEFTMGNLRVTTLSLRKV